MTPTNLEVFPFSPIHNGLSDHDAQVLKIKNVNLHLQKHRIYTIRNINNYSIEEFKTSLSCEVWDSIFSCYGNTDTDILFNLFHNNYLRIFYTSFTSQKIIERSNNNSWLKPGIRISCKRKRCLYLLTKDSDYVIFKNYNAQYCKTLTGVIKEAKIYMYIYIYMYNNRIINNLEYYKSRNK